MKRFIALAAISAALVGAAAVPALAVPGGGTGQTTFPIRCGRQVVTLTIANGTWSAAYVSETGERFIPKATYFSIVDATTGEVVFEEIDEKPNALRQSNLDCVESFPDEGLLVTFVVRGRLT